MEFGVRSGQGRTSAARAFVIAWALNVLQVLWGWATSEGRSGHDRVLTGGIAAPELYLLHVLGCDAAGDVDKV